MGRTREWTIVARLHELAQHLNARMPTPTEPGGRACLLETVLTLNQRLFRTKLVSSPTLVLERS